MKEGKHQTPGLRERKRGRRRVDTHTHTRTGTHNVRTNTRTCARRARLTNSCFCLNSCVRACVFWGLCRAVAAVRLSVEQTGVGTNAAADKLPNRPPPLKGRGGGGVDCAHPQPDTHASPSLGRGREHYASRTRVCVCVGAPACLWRRRVLVQIENGDSMASFRHLRRGVPTPSLPALRPSPFLRLSAPSPCSLSPPTPPRRC